MSRNPGQPQTNFAQIKEDRLIPNDKSYEIMIVTPMFGGGYEAGKVDEDRFVRESAIKGQLRFWWRATRGAAYDSAYELRKREAVIFGDTSRPSSVKVKIEILTKELATYVFGGKDSSIPSYLFQRSNKMDKQVTYISKGTFRLCLQWSAEAKALKKTEPGTFEELNRDLEAALWAWINFGGIGSRTRRGCGSLYCKNFSPIRSDCNESGFSKWLERCIKKYKLVLPMENGAGEWPTLNPNMLLKFDSRHNKDIWKFVIGQYKNFRRRARNDGGKIGRSYWPEADSVRNILNMAAPRHDTPIHFFRSNPKEEVIAFPRAEFGMPIVFHFSKPKGGEIKKSVLKKAIPREPGDTQLTPADKERLASPLILKTLAFNEEYGVGLIAVLNHPPIGNLELKYVENDKNKNYSVAMNSGRPLDYHNSPMCGRGHTIYPSAIDAFLNSEEVKQFCKLTKDKNT